MLDSDGNQATNVAHFDLNSPISNGMCDISKYVYDQRTFNQFFQETYGVYIQNQSEIGGFMYYFMIFRYSFSWEPLVLVGALFRLMGWLTWYDVVYKIKLASSFNRQAN
ncbi:hypothetical protein [Cyclobacterium salsum]|uniref:hypothetical protein n=1 Tax=Cyclobacterium salsum TaxID=2666329 RepID=UPI0013907330|nr:hypothetical protein [Cyclobacterium salsum]